MSSLNPVGLLSTAIQIHIRKVYMPACIHKSEAVTSFQCTAYLQLAPSAGTSQRAVNSSSADRCSTLYST